MRLSKVSASSLRKILAIAVGSIVLALLVTLYDARTGKIRADFTSYSLAASRVLYEGGDPYSAEEVGRNYKYFPINAVLLGPFTLFPVPLAQGLWFALNVVLLVWCFKRHYASAEPARVPYWVWAIALGISLRYLFENLKLGQWNTSVYCLAFIGWSFARRRPWVGAGLIGLAAALKFAPAFFALYYLAKRQWQTAVALVLSCVIWIVLLPAVILGPSRSTELLVTYSHKWNRLYSNMRNERFVHGYSLNATLYGYLTPAVREQTPFNILNLAPQTAGIIVDSLMLLLLIGVFALSVSLGYNSVRHSEEASSLVALLEIGLWFMLLLAIPAEVRKAHLLTTFTPAFALAVSLASGNVLRRGKILILFSLILSALFMLGSSSIVKGTVYDDIACTYGSYTFSFLVLGLGCAILLLKRKTFLRLNAPCRG